MKVYKIRDKKTGLFSTGGQNPKWTRNGKAWSSEGSLKSHLTQHVQGVYDYNLRSYRTVKVPKNWEIVEYEYVCNQMNTYPASVLAERPAKK